MSLGGGTPLGGDRSLTHPYPWHGEGDLYTDTILTFGPVTIHSTGEVDYPETLSETATAFWEAIIAAYPSMAPEGNEWYHIVYKTNLGQPIVTDIEFPSTEAAMDWLDSIGVTKWRISKMGSE